MLISINNVKRISSPIEIHWSEFGKMDYGVLVSHSLYTMIWWIYNIKKNNHVSVLESLNYIFRGFPGCSKSDFHYIKMITMPFVSAILNCLLCARNYISRDQRLYNNETSSVELELIFEVQRAVSSSGQ